MAYTQNELPNGLDTKTTSVDADVYILGDSADSGRAKGQTKANLVADLQSELDVETTAELNARDTANRDRANHTGTQSGTTIADGTIDEAKLDASTNASLDLADSALQSVVAGTNVTVDNTDPQNPIISSSGGGGGGDMSKSTYDTDNSGVVDEAEVITSQGALATLDTVGTAQIDNDAVTFDKIENIATNRVLARSSSGTGSVEDLTLPNFRTLINVEDGADVTDTANVTTAGALMDSEVSSLSGIKTLTVPDSTTISTFGASLVDDTSASAAQTTLGVQPTNDPTFTGEFTYEHAKGGVSALGNLGSAEAIDWSTATHFTGTLDNNVTITHSNEVSGQSVTLYLSYSGAQRTITWSDVDTWLDSNDGSAPAAPITTGDELVVTLQFVGTTCYASATGNYAVY